MKGEPKAVSRLEACSRSEVFLPQPVVAEISYGLERLPGSKRKAQLEERFALILSEVPRADWNDEVSLRFGAHKALLEQTGQLIEDFDLAIAAHALARGAILVTSNLKHMQRIPGLDLEDWGA